MRVRSPEGVVVCVTCPTASRSNAVVRPSSSSTVTIRAAASQAIGAPVRRLDPGGRPARPRPAPGVVPLKRSPTLTSRAHASHSNTVTAPDGSTRSTRRESASYRSGSGCRPHRSTRPADRRRRTRSLSGPPKEMSRHEYGSRCQALRTASSDGPTLNDTPPLHQLDDLPYAAGVDPSGRTPDGVVFPQSLASCLVWIPSGLAQARRRARPRGAASGDRADVAEMPAPAAAARTSAGHPSSSSRRRSQPRSWRCPATERINHATYVAIIISLNAPHGARRNLVAATMRSGAAASAEAAASTQPQGDGGKSDLTGRVIRSTGIVLPSDLTNGDQVTGAGPVLVGDDDARRVRHPDEQVVVRRQGECGSALVGDYLGEPGRRPGARSQPRRPRPARFMGLQALPLAAGHRRWGAVRGHGPHEADPGRRRR